MSNIDLNKLFNGDRRTLAKAITLVESTRPEDQNLAQSIIQSALKKTGAGFKIGITGTPGVGKSSFIETFGQYLINQNKKVAVLAIDPSSPLSGGSILGDKTRMEKLSQNENAFIRPSPSGGFLGGVAQKTREASILCEAAGFDYILIETVGVGQSEFEVSNMVDFYLMLMLPNSGDEIQGIKKGILELVDLIIINKADGPNTAQAKLSLAQITSALELFKHRPEWDTKAIEASSSTGLNIDAIFNIILNYRQIFTAQRLKETRAIQNQKWFKSIITNMIDYKIQTIPELKNEIDSLKKKISALEETPFSAAQFFVDKIFKK